MINLGKIQRQEKSTIYENMVSTHTTKENIFYPKGIISYPDKDAHSIVININNNTNTRIIIPIQNNENQELAKGDVMITDDNKNVIHLKAEDNEILIKSNKVVFDSEVEFQKDAKFKEGITNKGKDIGLNHSHKYEKPLPSQTVVGGAGGSVTVAYAPTDTQGVN